MPHRFLNKMTYKPIASNKNISQNYKQYLILNCALVSLNREKKFILAKTVNPKLR